MVEKGNGCPKELGKGCLGLLMPVFTPRLLERKKRKVEAEGQKYAKERAGLFEKEFAENPSLQKDYDRMMVRYGMNADECRKNIWFNPKDKEVVVKIEFRDPKIMREIFEDPELCPGEIEVFEGRVDDCGLGGNIYFTGGKLGEARVQFNYSNYLWGHGGFVLESGESWEDFGYVKTEGASGTMIDRYCRE